MKPLHFQKPLRLIPGSLMICLGFLLFANIGRAVVIYQTGFEPSEGYDTNADLVGQKGWVGAGSGGNGLLRGYLSGKGEQAYVGFAPPLSGDRSLFIYQPVNKTLPQAQFSVTMAVIDSTTTNRDDFYWSVFNQQGHQLFTLDFDNYELKLYYFLDNTNGRVASGLSFTNGGAYPLKVSMDFASNRWSAIFNGKSVATNQPLTTTSAALTLGDVDAAWAVYDPLNPGDNYMVFDDYRIDATAPSPMVSILGMVNGSPALRVIGLSGSQYALDVSSNLLAWVPVQTNSAIGGRFDFIHEAAAGLPHLFYRARWVP
jgi:hypothetical protein